MNQYIITEESICTIRDYILGAFYEGENKEKIYDLIKSEFSVMRSRPYQNQREKVLDDYCNIDLTRYVWGEMESEDVGLCRGKTCNYCGRYNEELRGEQ